MTREKSLLDQQFILVQNYGFAWITFRPGCQGRLKPCTHGFMDRLWSCPQTVAKKFTQEWVSRVNRLLIGFIAKDQPQSLEPLQMKYKLFIPEANQCTRHFPSSLHDPSQKLNLHATR